MSQSNLKSFAIYFNDFPLLEQNDRAIVMDRHALDTSRLDAIHQFVAVVVCDGDFVIGALHEVVFAFSHEIIHFAIKGAEMGVARGGAFGLAVLLSAFKFAIGANAFLASILNDFSRLIGHGHFVLVDPFTHTLGLFHAFSLVLVFNHALRTKTSAEALIKSRRCRAKSRRSLAGRHASSLAAVP